MTRPRSAFVAMGCSKTNARAVARFVFREPSTWELTEARLRDAPTSAGVSKPDDMHGTFQVSCDYTGCPSCRARNFVRCGACSQLSCFDGDGAWFTCSWCGNSGQISGSITSLNRFD